MEWLDVAIEEYKTLREESLTSIQMQQAVLRYGLAIIGVLTASALNSWDKMVLSGSVLLVFLPIICYLILMIWMGEVARMMRAGGYLYRLEKKINKYFQEDNAPLNWEIGLRDFSKGEVTTQLRWSYLAILGLLIFLAISSIAFGNYRIWNEVSNQFLLALNMIEIFVLVVSLVILVNSGMRFR